MAPQDPPGDAYLARETKARKEIDEQLDAAGWKVQSQKALNLSAGPGVAVREFTLEKPHGRVDYLMFLNGQPAGVIEAKPEGTPLVEVEHQPGKYVEGLPAWMQPPVYPLPFIRAWTRVRPSRPLKTSKPSFRAGTAGRASADWSMGPAG